MLCCFFIFTLVAENQAQTNWKLIYENDKEGNVLNGNKDELIQSARLGKDIKIHWKMGAGGNSVEHVADIQFISIIKGEVFGQISEINAQVPDFGEPTIDFLGKTIVWSLIASTSGKNATILYSRSDPSKEYKKMDSWGTKWYVREN